MTVNVGHPTLAGDRRDKILVAFRRRRRSSVRGTTQLGPRARMMRALTMGVAVLLAAAAAIAVAAIPAAAPALAQSGYDRPGGDYASAPVPNGDPAVCAARCERDHNCRAWSFSYPPPSGGAAMCWL